jgi:hypothetical protein
LFVCYFDREKRKKIPTHPSTPDPHEQVSKRMFDGKIKAWRRVLHMWDTPDIRPDQRGLDIKFPIPPASTKGTKRKLDESPSSSSGVRSSENDPNKKSRTRMEEPLIEKLSPAVQLAEENLENAGNYGDDIPVDYEDLEEEELEEGTDYVYEEDVL